MNWRLLLSHHQAHEHHRCVRVFGLHFCRRCTFLYPLTFACMVLQLAYHWVPESWAFYVMVLAPLPVTVAFVGEQLSLFAYKAWMVVVGSLLMAPALGLGFARYVQQPMDGLFWGMVLIYGGPALASVIYHHLFEEPSTTNNQVF